MALSFVKVQQKCHMDISGGSNIHRKKNYTPRKDYQNKCVPVQQMQECLTDLALIQNKLYSHMVVVKGESSLDDYNGTTKHNLYPLMLFLHLMHP